MASIVLGVGTSHTPMLSMGAASWRRWAARDAAKTDLRDESGIPVTFAQLLAARGSALADELTDDVFESKIARTEAALSTLSARVREARLDAVIVVGDDQDEHLGVENLPPVLIFHGASLRNTKAVVPPGAPPEIDEMLRGYYEPDRDVDYPVDTELAESVIGHLLDHGFDVATSSRLPRDRAEGHALQFPHRRLLPADLPVVPVLLNTYLPPAQPRAARCFDLGVAIAAAVEATGGSRRVGVVASGGLSHFVVLEEWDRAFLRALMAGDSTSLRGIPEAQLQSGNSEVKNWIAAAGVCRGLRFDTVDYVPGYRTLAGTGTAMAFGMWT